MTWKILSLLPTRLYQWRKGGGGSLLLTIQTWDSSETQLPTESQILNFKYCVEMNAPNQEFLHKNNTWVLRHFVKGQSFNISIIPVSFLFFWQCFGRVLGTTKQLRTSFLSTAELRYLNRRDLLCIL